MQILTNFAPVFNTILILCASLGALWAYRNGMAKTLNEVQDRVINALKNEIEACKDRLDRVEKEYAEVVYDLHVQQVPLAAGGTPGLSYEVAIELLEA